MGGEAVWEGLGDVKQEDLVCRREIEKCGNDLRRSKGMGLRFVLPVKGMGIDWPC